jgi:hypothetical protein
MSEWKWYYSHDEENYQEAESREAAIRELDGYGGTILEATRDVFDFSVDGDAILEQIDDNNSERFGPDGDGVFPTITTESSLALGLALKNAVTSWISDQKIKIAPCWAFKEMRNQELIEPDKPAEFDQ